MKNARFVPEIHPLLEERFIELPSGKMRYLTGGTGKPLVLCHGFLSSGEEFGGRFMTLAAQRLIVAPDLPGNGQSTSLAVPHTSKNLAASVWELTQALNLETFDAGGLCLGASVACALAQAHPSSVEHLILHTPLLGNHLIKPLYQRQITLFTRPRLWELISWLGRQRKVSDLYKRLFIEDGSTDATTENINFLNQQRADLHAAREWLLDSLKNQDVDLLVKRSAPTLIITPEHDRLIDIKKLIYLANTLPHIELSIDSEGGHGWTPEAVNRHLEILQNFLNQTSLRAVQVN